MKLADIAIATYIYYHMTNYDHSYQKLVDNTDRLDLNLDTHRKFLLKWLNAWGCRQFKTDFHDLASKEIQEWYQSNQSLLFSPDKHLLMLSNSDIGLVEKVYDNLVCRIISQRQKKKSIVNENVTIGPTGAAKILYALRPFVFIPWDVPMRREFKLNGSGRSYIKYLEIVRMHLRELEEECIKNGFQLLDLPNRLGKGNSSILKLVDEYFWITITNKFPIPTKTEISLWASWL
jgi:hypothetical protein